MQCHDVVHVGGCTDPDDDADDLLNMKANVAEAFKRPGTSIHYHTIIDLPLRQRFLYQVLSPFVTLTTEGWHINGTCSMILWYHSDYDNDDRKEFVRNRMKNLVSNTFEFQDVIHSIESFPWKKLSSFLHGSPLFDWDPSNIRKMPASSKVFSIGDSCSVNAKPLQQYNLLVESCALDHLGQPIPSRFVGLPPAIENKPGFTRQCGMQYAWIEYSQEMSKKFPLITAFQRSADSIGLTLAKFTGKRPRNERGQELRSRINNSNATSCLNVVDQVRPTKKIRINGSEYSLYDDAQFSFCHLLNEISSADLNAEVSSDIDGKPFMFTKAVETYFSENGVSSEDEKNSVRTCVLSTLMLFGNVFKDLSVVDEKLILQQILDKCQSCDGIGTLTTTTPNYDGVGGYLLRSTVLDSFNVLSLKHISMPNGSIIIEGQEKLHVERFAKNEIIAIEALRAYIDKKLLDEEGER